jgi:hypothetical protein
MEDHVTHFDDCSCKSAAYEKQIAELNLQIKTLELERLILYKMISVSTLRVAKLTEGNKFLNSENNRAYKLNKTFVNICGKYGGWNGATNSKGISNFLRASFGELKRLRKEKEKRNENSNL